MLLFIIFGVQMKALPFFACQKLIFLAHIQLNPSKKKESAFLNKSNLKVALDKLDVTKGFDNYLRDNYLEKHRYFYFTFNVNQTTKY